MAKSFPLFKGATRVATKMGVPLVPLVGFVVVVACVALIFGLMWFGLLLPGWALMAAVTKNDDRAFRILWLWGATKLRNRVRLSLAIGSTDFWGASTYALVDGRRKGRKGWSVE